MQEEKQNNSEKLVKNIHNNRIVVFLILIILFLILITVIFETAYSRYMEQSEGQVSGEIAKMICEMEVIPSEADKTIINPYCMVTVKNYNSNNEITETNVKYTIDVVAKENFEMPEYYWQDTNGTILARSTSIKGNFENEVKKSDGYKIVFMNTGEQNITRLVEFKLTAIQDIEE